MSDTIVMDADALREDVREKYPEVAVKPDGEYHLHTGRPLAKRLGYDDSLVQPMPDEAFGDDRIRPTIGDRHLLNEPLPELDIAEPHGSRRPAGPVEHLLGHVDTDDLSTVASLSGCSEAIETSGKAQ